MDEVYADFLPDNQMNNMQFLNQIIQKSLCNGVQIGIPWNKDVYEYIFESGDGVSLASILNMNVIVAEIQQDSF